MVNFACSYHPICVYYPIEMSAPPLPPPQTLPSRYAYVQSLATFDKCVSGSSQSSDDINSCVVPWPSIKTYVRYVLSYVATYLCLSMQETELFFKAMLPLLTSIPFSARCYSREHMVTLICSLILISSIIQYSGS